MEHQFFVWYSYCKPLLEVSAKWDTAERSLKFIAANISITDRDKFNSA
jgi:hypothetical protein